MTELFTALAAICLLLGSFFTLLSGFGLLKFKTFSVRLHSASLSSSLGILLIMLGAGFWHSDPDVWLRVLLIVLFTFTTTPIAAHVLARANHLKQKP